MVNVMEDLTTLPIADLTMETIMNSTMPFWIAMPCIHRVGDGKCDSFAPYNTDECDFDGGD